MANGPMFGRAPSGALLLQAEVDEHGPQDTGNNSGGNVF
jgi:hypothetical protein